MPPHGSRSPMTHYPATAKVATSRTKQRAPDRRRGAHADSSFPRHAHGGQSPDESHAARRQPGWQLPQTDQHGESYRPPSHASVVNGPRLTGERVFDEETLPQSAASRVAGNQEGGATAHFPVGLRDWVEEDKLADRKGDLVPVLEANRKLRNGSTDLPPKQVEDPPVDGYTERHHLQEAAAGWVVAAVWVVA